MVNLKFTPWVVFTALSFSRAARAKPTSAEPMIINGVNYNTNDVEVVHRDVVIVGGGSTGTYAAINLLDSAKSVALIEKRGHLGGHTETYTDPATGRTNDFGVILFHDTDVVKNYAARLNVTLAPVNLLNTRGGPTVFADFRTGIQNSTFSNAGFTTGLTLYAEQLAKYPYLGTGFDLPNPVPEDLLLSFGDFAIKYQLGTDFINFLHTFAQGLGDLLSKPTLYVFKNFGMSVLESLRTNFLTSAVGDNSLIYKAAHSIIGNKNIFFDSDIIAVNRSVASARVLIKTPSGLKLIEAKKLLFTIPPKTDNLCGWDLTQYEQQLFSQFNNSGYYVGVINNTGLPAGMTVNNVASNAPYGIPPLPAAYSLSPSTIPDVFNLFYGSATALSDGQVRAAMLEEVDKLQVANKTATKANLLQYARHEPFELWVPGSAIKAGFYRDLTALQGQMSTYYTGAAFHTHDSSLLWEFTERVIQNFTTTLR